VSPTKITDQLIFGDSRLSNDGRSSPNEPISSKDLKEMKKAQEQLPYSNVTGNFGHLSIQKQTST